MQVQRKFREADYHTHYQRGFILSSLTKIKASPCSVGPKIAQPPHSPGYKFNVQNFLYQL